MNNPTIPYPNQNSVSTSATQQPVKTLSFIDFFFLCLERWYVFVIAVVLALCLAYVKLAMTAPLYKSWSCIVIKQDRRTGNSGLEMSTTNFSNLGSLFSQQTNVHNEIIAFQSPYLMEQVVRRLDLRANYFVRASLHKRVLYGSSLPIRVVMLDFPDEGSVGMKIRRAGPESVQLSELYTFINSEKVKFEAPLEVNFRDTVETPVGRLVILPELGFYSLPEDKFPAIEMTYSPFESCVNRVASHLSVGLTEKEATAVSLMQIDASAERARDILSCLIDVYNERWVGDRNQISASTSKFINERLVVIEKELGSVDSDLSAFKSRNQILDPQAAGGLYMTQASKLQSDLMVLENRLGVALFIRDYMAETGGKNQLLPANSGIENISIEAAISEYNMKQLQRNTLVSNSSAQNPVVVELDFALASMHSSILASIDNYITVLNEQIKSFRQTEAQNIKKISASPMQVEHLTDIERQQKVKESLYLYLLQKREENELSQAFMAYNTRILTPPTLVKAPVSPKRSRIFFVALLLGLALPGAFFYVREVTNNKLRTRKDLENTIIPFVGEIPLSYKPRIFDRFRKSRDCDEIVVRPRNRNVINEAFRVVRSNLEFIVGENAHNVLEMTSFNPGSGKTFVTANLGCALAIKGQRVCVVDLDLRKAQLSSYVGSPSKGIADYLSGKITDIDAVIIKGQIVENMDVIPVGVIPPNPSELLYSNRLRDLIAELKKKYDYVFLDCPPVEIVADPAIINRYADRTIFLVRAGVLDKSLLPDIDRFYEEGKYNNMMLLMNGTSIGGHFSYGRYAYGHKYAYGNYSSKKG